MILKKHLYLFTLPVAILASCHQGTAKVPAKSVCVEDSATITLKGSIDSVFPLFNPKREKDWAEGWDYELIYPNSDLILEGMVIQPKSHHHLHDNEPRSTWVLSGYDTLTKTIQYTCYNSDWITIIDIYCREAGDFQTMVAIRYRYVGLTENGNNTIKEKLDHIYARRMKDWELAINHYLKTGTLLTH